MSTAAFTLSCVSWFRARCRCFYQGGVQYFVWNVLLEKAMPTGHFLKKVAVVNGIIDPVFFSPASTLRRSSFTIPERCVARAIMSVGQRANVGLVPSRCPLTLHIFPGSVPTSGLAPVLRLADGGVRDAGPVSLPGELFAGLAQLVDDMGEPGTRGHCTTTPRTHPAF